MAKIVGWRTPLWGRHHRLGNPGSATDCDVHATYLYFKTMVICINKSCEQVMRFVFGNRLK